MAKVSESVSEIEHRALREGAGLVDRSERGVVVVRGDDGAEFLQGQVSNDVESLEPGEGCYAVLLNHKGKMQSDLRLLRREDDFLLDTEAVALEGVLQHLNTYKIGRSVEIEDATADIAIISLQGTESRSTVEEALAEGTLPAEAEHSHTRCKMDGTEVLLVAADYGTPGVDLLLRRDGVEATVNALVDGGAVRASHTAAECVRIEGGRPRYGLDMTAETFPQEAGVNDRAVDFEKGCYIGQEPVARMRYRGHPNRHLRGLKCIRPVEPGASVSKSGKKLGVVTSATVSPGLGAIALAMVRREVEPGDEVAIETEDRAAQVVELPFNKNK